ncbi:MAG: Prolipoprotein diacylglyceryltransferase [Firmicutes bacterium]|jgi:phosphatidylglycerol---prolipoprotein diacylglyceryl transferase|nr:Prolipoprotein diacylglyceryltransferase [Bacillota bacterium]
MDIIAFSMGNLNFYWYGIVTSIAILAGILVTRIGLHFRHEKFSVILDLLLFGIPVAIIVSRLFYVCLHWQLYSEKIGEIIALDRGGFSIYGAFVGFLLVVYCYTKFKKISFWYWLDILVPAIILGIIIDQLGHFCFQTIVGMPDNGKTVEYIEYAFRPAGFEQYEYFKPVALYQAIWQFSVFVLVTLLSFFQIKNRTILFGDIFLIGMSITCLGRFLFGFFYLTTQRGMQLHAGQFISLLGLILCLVLWGLRKYFPHKEMMKNIFRV